jgi:hypothetical protein
MGSGNKEGQVMIQWGVLSVIGAVGLTFSVLCYPRMSAFWVCLFAGVLIVSVLMFIKSATRGGKNGK